MPHDNVVLFGAELPFTQQLSLLLRQDNIDVVHFTSAIDHEPSHSNTINNHNINLISERDPTVHCQADVILDPCGVSHLSVALSFLKRSGGRILLYHTTSSNNSHDTAVVPAHSNEGVSCDNDLPLLSNETIQLLFRRNVTLQFANMHRLDHPLKRQLRTHFDTCLRQKTQQPQAPLVSCPGDTPPTTNNSSSRHGSGTNSWDIIECDFAELKDIQEAFRSCLHSPPLPPPTAGTRDTPQPKAVVLHFNSVATAVSELSQELDVLLHQKHRWKKFAPNER